MRLFRIYYTTGKGINHYWTNGGWSGDPRDAHSMSEARAVTFTKNQPQCDYEEVPITPIKRSDLVTVFILIQNNKVLDRSITPNFLRIGKLDAYAGFKIAIGCINETGGREIVGIVADVGPLSGAKTWRISSPQDGLYRLVGVTDSPVELVTRRLGVMQGAGQFCDLTDLPVRVVLTAFGPVTPLSVEDVTEALVP
jgi:hypothetical protein